MRGKYWKTQGVGRGYVDVNVLNTAVSIIITDTALTVIDELYEPPKEREKIGAFLDMYVSDTLKRKIIKWIYETC